MANKTRGRPAGQGGQAPVLANDEIRRVMRLARARQRHGIRAEVALSLSFYLGLRAKEIASLKWNDVYDGNGEVKSVLTLYAAYTKGSKTRSSFLTSPQLRSCLTRYGKDSSLNFWKSAETALLQSQQGGHLRPASIVRMLKQLFIEVGLPHASSHTGRRTFITSLAERGIDLKAIAMLAGHSNIRTTALYVDASPQKLSRILAEVAW